MSTLQLQNKYVWCWTLTTTLHATCCVVHKSHSFALFSNWILSPKFYISCLLKITLICFYFSSFFSNVLKVHICSKNILAIAFVLFLLLLLCNHLSLTELLVFPKTDEEYIDHVGCRCISVGHHFSINPLAMVYNILRLLCWQLTPNWKISTLQARLFFCSICHVGCRCISVGHHFSINPLAMV